MLKNTNTKLNRITEDGFSLVEVMIAFSILFISLMGVLYTITYAVNYNSGNSLRAQSQAVLQQQIETLQSAKFNLVETDQILTGGTKLPAIVKTADGNNFRVDISVDDDPFVSGIQTDSTKTLKEITLVVVPENVVAGWQNSIATKAVIRRVRGN